MIRCQWNKINTKGNTTKSLGHSLKKWLNVFLFILVKLSCFYVHNHRHLHNDGRRLDFLCGLSCLTGLPFCPSLQLSYRRVSSSKHFGQIFKFQILGSLNIQFLSSPNLQLFIKFVWPPWSISQLYVHRKLEKLW